MTTPFFPIPPSPYGERGRSENGVHDTSRDSQQSFSSDLESSGRSSDGSPRSRHQWNTDERLSLCILKRFYTPTWAEISRIMSAAFALSARTNRTVLTGHRVNMASAQFSDLKLLLAPEYREIYHGVMFDQPLTDHLATLEKRLNSAAHKTGISLERRREEDFEALKNFNRARAASRKAAKGTTTSPLHSSGTSDLNKSMNFVSEEERSLSQCSTTLSGPSDSYVNVASVDDVLSVAIHRDTRKQIFATNDTASASCNPVHRPKSAMFLPPILFRAYSEDSNGINTGFGIRAGLFSTLDAHKVFTPSTDDPQFSDHVVNHLSRSLIQSPLISLTSSLIWALHKAFSSPEISNIAIIETRTATKNTRVWHAAPLCTQARKIKPVEIRNYKATFEYFAWSAIHGDAIISTFKLADLRDFCAKNSCVSQLLQLDRIQVSKNISEARSRLEMLRIGYDVGAAIGKLIQFVRPGTFMNEPFVDDFTQVILQNWDKKKKTVEHKIDIIAGSDLFRGIHEGLGLQHDRSWGPPLRGHEDSRSSVISTLPVTPPWQKLSRRSSPWSNQRPTAITKVIPVIPLSKHVYPMTPDATPASKRRVFANTIARSLIGNLTVTPESSLELQNIDENDLSDTSQFSESSPSIWPAGCREKFIRNLATEGHSPLASDEAEDDCTTFIMNDNGQIMDHDETFITLTNRRADLEKTNKAEEHHDVSFTINVEEGDSEAASGSEEDGDRSAGELMSTCRCHIGGHMVN